MKLISKFSALLRHIVNLQNKMKKKKNEAKWNRTKQNLVNAHHSVPSSVNLIKILWFWHLVFFCFRLFARLGKRKGKGKGKGKRKKPGD